MWNVIKLKIDRKREERKKNYRENYIDLFLLLYTLEIFL